MRERQRRQTVRHNRYATLNCHIPSTLWHNGENTSYSWTVTLMSQYTNSKRNYQFLYYNPSGHTNSRHCILKMIKIHSSIKTIHRNVFGSSKCVVLQQHCCQLQREMIQYMDRKSNYLNIDTTLDTEGRLTPTTTRTDRRSETGMNSETCRQSQTSRLTADIHRLFY